MPRISSTSIPGPEGPRLDHIRVYPPDQDGMVEAQHHFADRRTRPQSHRFADEESLNGHLSKHIWSVPDMGDETGRENEMPDVRREAEGPTSRSRY